MFFMVFDFQVRIFTFSYHTLKINLNLLEFPLFCNVQHSSAWVNLRVRHSSWS